MNKLDKIDQLIATSRQTICSLDRGEISKSDADLVFQTIKKELKELDLDKTIETFIHSLF
jgi:hypothetical protein